MSLTPKWTWALYTAKPVDGNASPNWAVEPVEVYEADAVRRVLEEMQQTAPTFTGDTVNTYNLGLAEGYTLAVNRLKAAMRQEERA